MILIEHKIGVHEVIHHNLPEKAVSKRSLWSLHLAPARNLSLGNTI